MTWNWAHFFIGGGVWLAAVTLTTMFSSMSGIADRRHAAMVEEKEEEVVSQ